MAEGIFRKILDENNIKDISCESAGLSAVPLEPASKFAVDACSEIDIDIKDKRAQIFATRHVEDYDCYFTMTETHAYILQQAGVVADKIFVPETVPDPYGGTLNDYRRCRDHLEKILIEFFPRLLKMVKSNGVL